METPLTNALQFEIQRGRHRFHVPAHAGSVLGKAELFLESPALYQADLTELPSLDVLGDPQGVLQASQASVAQVFGTAQSYYLINGASTGIMAALLATGINEGQTILVARNCHRSVLHALILSGATPQWLLLPYHAEWGLWGAVDSQVLLETLQVHPEIRAFVMTHPTYEGIASDIDAIAEICRQASILLIVDEAHGALWPLHSDLPTSALQVPGVDAVVHSLHKSGGSLTQTALLHLPHDSRIQPPRLQQALNVLLTTSPSYPLLVNLESIGAFWSSDEGEALLERHIQRVKALRSWITQTLTSIHSLPAQGFQLFLKSTHLAGDMLAEQLEEAHDIAYEAATPSGVLLMLNIGLPDASFEALKLALLKINEACIQQMRNLLTATPYPPHPNPPPAGRGDLILPQRKLTPRQAFFAQGDIISKQISIGEIAQQIVAPCPPGIPVLMPGEVIEIGHLPFLPDMIQIVAEID